jgi:hypothetical protein
MVEDEQNCTGIICRFAQTFKDYPMNPHISQPYLTTKKSKKSCKSQFYAISREQEVTRALVLILHLVVRFWVRVGSSQATPLFSASF